MMLEQHSMERAELYALGFLSESESSEFEHQLKHDEDLRQYLNELNDSVAAVALTAPQLSPPVGTFQAIEEQINRSPVSRNWHSRFSLPIWAAVAIVFLSAISIHQVVRNHSSQMEITRLQQALEDAIEEGPPKHSPSPGEDGKGTRAILSHDRSKEDYEVIGPNTTTRDHYRLTQSLKSLRNQVNKLRAANDERFAEVDGVSRMVVIEMLDPSLDSKEKHERRMVLPVEVSDILASGLDLDSPPKKNTVTLTGTDNSWEGQVVIESGMVNLDLINLPKGETILHKNFPLDDIDSYRGIEKLPDGKFYDIFGDILWQPGLNGEYVGSRPNEPVEIPNPPEEPLVEETNLATQARAFTLFDETTGQGSILVSNLPSPGEGFVYQLWMNAPDQDQPISLGVIPELENGSGRIGFELPGADFSPSNYRLTVEPTGGSYQPTGSTILTGP